MTGGHPSLTALDRLVLLIAREVQETVVIIVHPHNGGRSFCSVLRLEQKMFSGLLQSCLDDVVIGRRHRTRHHLETKLQKSGSFVNDNYYYQITDSHWQHLRVYTD